MNQRELQENMQHAKMQKKKKLKNHKQCIQHSTELNRNIMKHLPFGLHGRASSLWSINW